jgi:hypothetical protein
LDVQAADRAVWHGTEGGFFRFLNDSGAILLLNLPKSGRAVVEETCEQDAGDALSIGAGG